MSPYYFWTTGLLFAEGEAAGQGGAPASSPLQYLPLLVIGVLFYFILIRPESRKRNEHKALLEGLKRNDRVVTVGGIYGTVANVQREADRVTLKVDEGNNVKIDVTVGSIARVLGGAAEGEKESS